MLLIMSGRAACAALLVNLVASQARSIVCTANSRQARLALAKDGFFGLDAGGPPEALYGDVVRRRRRLRHNGWLLVSELTY